MTPKQHSPTKAVLVFRLRLWVFFFGGGLCRLFGSSVVCPSVVVASQSRLLASLSSFTFNQPAFLDDDAKPEKKREHAPKNHWWRAKDDPLP